MIKKRDTSWNGVAKWYDSLLNMDGTYQKEVILPNLLRLLGLKKDEKILDIACGQGFFSREIARLGGEVTGVDLAPELIKFAKEKASEKEKYFLSPADDLGSVIKDESFDKVIIVLAIQNIENLSGALKEANRALRKGGKLFLVLNHPIFRNPKNTFWGFDEKSKTQYRRIDSYLSESRSEIDMAPGSKKNGSDKLTISFHRPLQTYFKFLIKNNFLISRLEEWVSNKKSEAGPRQKAEDKARREIPLFLMIEALKVK